MKPKQIKATTAKPIQGSYQRVSLTSSQPKTDTTTESQHLRTVSTSVVSGTVSLRYSPRDIAPSNDAMDEQ
jgi:hypothetical protein